MDITNCNNLTICRACMENITPPDSCKPLFSDRIAEMFTTCTNIEIENSDGLPAHICLRCFQFLYMVYNFKEQCIASDLKLKELLTKRSTLVEDPLLITEHHDSARITIKDEYPRDKHDSKAWCLPVEVLADTCAYKNLKANTFDCKSEPVELSEEDVKTQIYFNSSEHTGMNVSKNNHKTNVECKKVSILEELLEKDRNKRRGTHKSVSPPFICLVCSRNFTKKRNLTRHMVQHNVGRTFKCDVCDKSFVYSGMLKEHKKIHGPHQSVCHLCGKTFLHQTHLTSHMVSHTSDRPFTCNICGMKFKSKASLNSHELRHTTDRKYVCSTCGSKFITRSELTNHARSHTNERKFACSACEKTFTTKSQLTVHMRVHSDSRPYSCDLCPKSFNLTNVLKNHRMTHTGEKPHVCTVCQQAFRQSQQLGTHMKVHRRKKRSGSIADSDARATKKK